MKLRKKLLLFTVGIVLMSLVLISITNYTIAIKRFEMEVNRSSQLESDNLSSSMDTWIALQKKIIHELGEFILIGDNYEGDYLKKLVGRVHKDNPENEYYVGFDNEEFYAGSGWIPGSDFKPTTRGWYIGAHEANGDYITEPYIDAITGEMVITISRPLSLPGGRKAGVGADIPISHMVDLVSSVDFGPGSYGFLMDDMGNIVTHGNKDFLPTIDDGFKNVKDILGGRLSPMISKTNMDLKARKLKDFDGKNRYFFFSKLNESGWTMGVAISEDLVSKDINNMILYTLLSAGFILLISLAIAFYLARTITRPVEDAVATAGTISNLDLSVRIPDNKLNRKDEMGNMYRSFGETIDKLRDFMEELDRSIAINNQVQDESLERIESLLSQAEDTSATTEELSAGMEETTATTLSVNQSTMDMERALTDFTGKIEASANTSREISEKADVLSRQFIEAKDRSMSVYETTRREIDLAIESSKEVEKIEILSSAILEISEQTSLLSLNASIEAARAGESGRGFAVVANEIGKLAEHSNKTVGEIQEVTRGITGSVNHLVQEVNQIMTYLEEDVNKDYELMVGAVTQYQRDGQDLYDLISELAARSQELLSTVNEIAGSIGETTVTIEEATIATSNIAEKNTEMVATLDEIFKIIERSHQVSNGLEEIVSQVKLD